MGSYNTKERHSHRFSLRRINWETLSNLSLCKTPCGPKSERKSEGPERTPMSRDSRDSLEMDWDWDRTSSVTPSHLFS
jgi:hypothetical protein